MNVIVITALSGVGLGLLTWYGWGLVENLLAIRARRQTPRTKSDDVDS